MQNSNPLVHIVTCQVLVLSLKLYHNMPYSIPASDLELEIFKNSEKGGTYVPSKYNDTNCYRIGN